MADASLPRGLAVPPAGPVTIHFDGACQVVRGRRVAAYGWTAEGPGFVREEFDLAVPPGHVRATNNVAEYVGAIRAIEWLASTPYRGAVTVVGDSELVVRQMLGTYEVRADHLRPYHDRLAQLAALFASTEFRSVPREANERADALSKLGLAKGSAPPARRADAADARDQLHDGAPPSA